MGVYQSLPEFTLIICLCCMQQLYIYIYSYTNNRHKVYICVYILSIYILIVSIVTDIYNCDVSTSVTLSHDISRIHALLLTVHYYINIYRTVKNPQRHVW